MSLSCESFSACLLDEVARSSWPHAGCERIDCSSSEWVARLLGPTLFAAVFDPERLLQVRAALSLNRAPRGETANGACPVRWHRELADVPALLAARRDGRIASIVRASYQRMIDPMTYNRVPRGSATP